MVIQKEKRKQEDQEEQLKKWGWGHSSAAELMPNMSRPLDLILRPEREKQKEEQREEEGPKT